MSTPSHDQIPKPALGPWLFLSAFFPGSACWILTQDIPASLLVAALGPAGLLLASREIRMKSELGIFVELQLFLLRCRILPEDTKIQRNIPLSKVREKKRELMDMASERFQESEKKLTETRHVLDKFVGTKASHFATQKGKQAVWEGELIRAIILISDVRGFTAMTEKLKPQETIRYLNRMFTEFEEIISFSGGEINKFMGDSIMAFFPFPPETEEASAKKALLAALRIQDSFHQLQRTFDQNYSESIHTGLGVGMASGQVLIGNLGSARRMEFTLIGDTVNFASRLCSIAEDGQILIHQDLALVSGDSFRMEALDPVRIKGKSGTHRPYAVMGEKLHQGLS